MTEERDRCTPQVTGFAADVQKILDTYPRAEDIMEAEERDAAEVLEVNIRQQWSDDKQSWWSSSTIRIALLNPKTMERYAHSNWKSEVFTPRDGTLQFEEEIKNLLLPATVPFVRVVVTEVPLERPPVVTSSRTAEEQADILDAEADRG